MRTRFKKYDLADTLMREAAGAVAEDMDFQLRLTFLWSTGAFDPFFKPPYRGQSLLAAYRKGFDAGLRGGSSWTNPYVAPGAAVYGRAYARGRADGLLARSKLLT